MQNTPRCILAIDPSLSSTGIALFVNEDTNIPICKRIQTTQKMGDTDDRILVICNMLNEIALIYEISDVIFEDGYIGPSPKTGIQLAMLRGALCYMFKSSGISVVHMQPSEIRKVFGLKGNATKEEVALKVQGMYPLLKSQIGEYSDKNNKKKTSDMYDAVSIGVAYINMQS